MAKQWERRKYIFVLQYISCNILLSYIIIAISDYPIARNYVILISMCLVVFLLLFRLIPAFIYLVSYTCKRACGPRISNTDANENRRNGERILQALKNI